MLNGATSFGHANQHRQGSPRHKTIIPKPARVHGSPPNEEEYKYLPEQKRLPTVALNPQDTDQRLEGIRRFQGKIVYGVSLRQGLGPPDQLCHAQSLQTYGDKTLQRNQHPLIEPPAMVQSPQYPQSTYSVHEHTQESGPSQRHQAEYDSWEYNPYQHPRSKPRRGWAQDMLGGTGDKLPSEPASTASAEPKLTWSGEKNRLLDKMEAAGLLG